MGFFKAERELMKQAKDIQKQAGPVKDRMAAAQDRMNQTMQAMAAQTEAANMAVTLGQTGTPVSVTVVSATQTAQINFNVMLQVEAMVYPDGQPPYPAQIPLTVSQMQAPFVQPGKTFSGKVAPDDRQKVWIDPTSIQ
ncbi:MAG TPA: hypothetical protein VGF36_16155 [Rhodopila sp.]